MNNDAPKNLMTVLFLNTAFSILRILNILNANEFNFLFPYLPSYSKVIFLKKIALSLVR